MIMAWLETVLAVIGGLVILCLAGGIIRAIIAGVVDPHPSDEPMGDGFDYRPYHKRHPEQPRKRWRITVERR